MIAVGRKPNNEVIDAVRPKPSAPDDVTLFVSRRRFGVAITAARYGLTPAAVQATCRRVEADPDELQRVHDLLAMMADALDVLEASAAVARAQARGAAYLALADRVSEMSTDELVEALGALADARTAQPPAGEASGGGVTVTVPASMLAQRLDPDGDPALPDDPASP